MYHARCPVTPLNSEVAWVGDVAGQRRNGADHPAPTNLAGARPFA